jgi:hypothetical protein
MSSPQYRQDFAEAGGVWLEPGESAAGTFCSVQAVGGAANLTGVAAAQISGMPATFTLASGQTVKARFTAVTNDAGSAGDVFCVNAILV